MNREWPVPLFVPPEPAPRPAVSVPLPVLPEPLESASLLLGMATIDHSGRFGDGVLITALGWRPGDQVEVLPRTAVLRRSLSVPSGQSGPCVLAAGHPHRTRGSGG